MYTRALRIIKGGGGGGDQVPFSAVLRSILLFFSIIAPYHVLLNIFNKPPKGNLEHLSQGIPVNSYNEPDIS